MFYLKFTKLKFKIMKFKIGDRVSFIDDKGGGIIRKIVDENIVHVEIEDGFEIPTSVANLILISGIKPENYTKEISYKEEDTIDSSSKILPLNPEGRKEIDEGIYFAVVPENKEDFLAGDLELYLINNTDYQIQYSFFLNKSGEFSGYNNGVLKAEAKIFLDSVERSKIEDWVNSYVQVVFFKEGKAELLQPFGKFVDFKPVKTYKEDAFKYRKILNDKAIFVELKLKKDLIFNPYASQDIKPVNIDELKEKYSTEEKRKKTDVRIKTFLDKHKIDDKTAEVDLHINKLVDDASNKDSKELLKIQLDYFKRAIDQAQIERLKKIVFIHGVGEGVLKKEIENYLKTEDGIQYYDASYSRYGMGATEVLFYRNK